MSPFKKYDLLLQKHLRPETIPLLELAWKEPHRKYHNINHLESIINEIEKSRFDVHPYVYEALLLAAFFHDCYYQPKDNKIDEDESIKRFLSSYRPMILVESRYVSKEGIIINKKFIENPNSTIRNLVVEMINSTKFRKIPKNTFAKILWKADNLLFYKNYQDLIEYEKLIREEFIHVFPFIYKKKRIEFLKSNLGLFNADVDDNLNKLIKYVSDKY